METCKRAFSSSGQTSHAGHQFLGVEYYITAGHTSHRGVVPAALLRSKLCLATIAAISVSSRDLLRGLVLVETFDPLRSLHHIHDTTATVLPRHPHTCLSVKHGASSDCHIRCVCWLRQPKPLVPAPAKASISLNTMICLSSMERPDKNNTLNRGVRWSDHCSGGASTFCISVISCRIICFSMSTLSGPSGLSCLGSSWTLYSIVPVKISHASVQS